MNGEDLYITVSGYVAETIDLFEDPDGAVEAAERKVLGLPKTCTGPRGTSPEVD